MPPQNIGHIHDLSTLTAFVDFDQVRATVNDELVNAVADFSSRLPMYEETMKAFRMGV